MLKVHYHGSSYLEKHTPFFKFAIHTRKAVCYRAFFLFTAIAYTETSVTLYINLTLAQEAECLKCKLTC